jgi:8-oxo-dGTP pyrophosphatase MutT (NUDIX family)
MSSRGGPEFRDAIARLRQRLALPLPGPAAMMAMAAAGRAFTPEGEALRQGAARAAALVLIYPDGANGDAHVALTARAGDLRHHAGQVSFPGGRIDDGESVEAAALREAREELAVPSDGLAILGRLTPLYIPPSGFLLYPVVAAADIRPDFQANAAEVAALLEVPVAVLLDPRRRSSALREVRGAWLEVPFFAVAGHEVWGATAMILAELAVIWPGAA